MGGLASPFNILGWYTVNIKVGSYSANINDIEAYACGDGECKRWIGGQDLTPPFSRNG